MGDCEEEHEGEAEEKVGERTYPNHWPEDDLPPDNRVFKIEKFYEAMRAAKRETSPLFAIKPPAPRRPLQLDGAPPPSAAAWGALGEMTVKSEYTVEFESELIVDLPETDTRTHIDKETLSQLMVTAAIEGRDAVMHPLGHRASTENDTRWLRDSRGFICLGRYIYDAPDGPRKINGIKQVLNKSHIAN
jgi:hypothetical protein